MKKLVITGAAGFVGSWICEKALAKGYEIIGIDNLSSGVNYTPKSVELVKKDLNEITPDIFKGVDGIVHAAAYAELRHNWKDKAERERLFSNNEVATINLLEQMPDVPIVFLSSASVYGSLANNKIKDRQLIEDDVGSEYIESPYAASKLACESYVAAWSFKKKIPWYCIRLVNQVGARGHRGVIADFLRMVRQEKHIHAADNGSQRKNWINVEDTADIVIRLLDENNRVPSGVYAATSQERLSWRDIVDVMKKMHQEKYPNTDEPFALTYEDCMAGAIGDPVNLDVSGDKLKPYYNVNRSVEKAIREALTFLGWPE